MKGERYCKCSGERKHWRGWVSGGQTIKYGGHVPDTQNLLMNIYWKNSEEAMAPHSSTLAWKVPWMEEPGRLQSMGSLRVRHEWATSLSLSCIGEGNSNPLPCYCLENPRDRGAWWVAVYGVAYSRTRLKRLSNSGSRYTSRSCENSCVILVHPD